MKLPEEVWRLRLHEDCGVALSEVRRRVKEVCISPGGGSVRVSRVIFTQSGGIIDLSMLACREAAESITDAEDISCLLKIVHYAFKGNQFIPLFQEKRLCAHPFLEIYRDGQIHFMAPLARQGDFYVPEVRRVERRSLKEELHSDSEVSGIN